MPGKREGCSAPVSSEVSGERAAQEGLGLCSCSSAPWELGEAGGLEGI